MNNEQNGVGGHDAMQSLNASPSQQQIPFVRAPLFNQPPPAVDNDNNRFQQHNYFAELFRQQQEILLRQQESMQQQQQAFITQQEQLMRNLFSSIHVQVPPNPEVILDSLGNNIREFRFDPDSSITFAAWYSRYQDLFEKDASRLDDEAKVRLLIRKLGISEHERYVSFIMPKTPKHFSFEETVSKLTSLFGASESVLSRRYRCLQIAKQTGEDFVTYSCRINKSCVEFQLSMLTEEQFKCLVFVCGLKSERDAEIRTRLLTRIEDNAGVTLEQLTEECQRLLNLRHDAALIEGPASCVKALKTKQFTKNFKRRAQSFRNGSDSRSSDNLSCWLCGGKHYARDCIYKSHKCSDCGVFGHKTGYCASAKKVNYRKYERKKENLATKVVKVNTCSATRCRKYVPVTINAHLVRMQLDTGSDITLISVETWRKIGSPKLRVPSIIAKTAAGRNLSIDGEFDCEIVINAAKSQGTVRVSKMKLQLLGSDMMELFGLWSVSLDVICGQVSSKHSYIETLKTEFPEVFTNKLGLCTKVKIKLELKPDKIPVFRPKRPVAYAVHQIVDDELDRLERENIITPVDFSEWAAPIVVVRKANGAIRICGDYSTGLNDALQPHQYPLPLPQDIFASLAHCTVFSQIDLTDAFLQLEVDEGSREMLTINTHRGLYRYNRLPPGVKAAPGAFQQVIDSMLAGLVRTSGYLDDVVVGGTDAKDHMKNLRAVLERIREFGFTIRLDKCTFGREQIRYLGHLLDCNGLRPDPAKIDVIKQLPAPTDVSEVRSFLGAINYYGKFVPNIRHLRFPLDELLKEGTKFRWTTECQSAFERFKEILGSDLLLTHYDPRHEIIVSADASSVGVGATISHRYPNGSMKVVQHAARALTKAEQRYSQPDREGLALIFAVTKFHKMLFGRKFLLQTDHAPLVRIFGSTKGIPVYTANRLQRWALTLLLYNFKIEYVPTAKFGNADILSRLIDSHVKPDEDYVIASITMENDIKAVIDEVASKFPLSFKVVEKDTQVDPLLRKVYRFVRDGWPEKLPVSDVELQRFYSRRDSLSTVQGCIMFADRLVIPEKYRKQCLQQLHQGHPGIHRMKALARSYIYWPFLDKEIASFVKGCTQCALAAKSMPHVEPVSWPVADGPWQRVHIDYAGPIDGDYFLLVIDACSKWPEIVATRRTSSVATISILRNLFSRFGFPETLVSDNGPQFTSNEFYEFCATSGIQHITSAPFHPQSNGQAERFVDTFKRALKKIQAGRKNMEEALDIFLLSYRSTPNRQVKGELSPAEIMFGRRIRTSLELLRPPVQRADSADSMTGVPRRSFVPHNLVYAKVYSRNKWSWQPGVVCERIGHVMYSVWINDQRLIKSHVNQLRDRTVSKEDVPVKKTKLPLDVLLDSWNLRVPVELPCQLSVSQSLISAPSPVCSKDETVVSERASADTQPSLSPSSTSSAVSSSAASLDFASAGSEPATPVPELPRRSSRTRRPPQWFDPYHLY